MCTRRANYVRSILTMSSCFTQPVELSSFRGHQYNFSRTANISWIRSSVYVVPSSIHLHWTFTLPYIKVFIQHIYISMRAFSLHKNIRAYKKVERRERLGFQMNAFKRISLIPLHNNSFRFHFAQEKYGQFGEKKSLCIQWRETLTHTWIDLDAENNFRFATEQRHS